MPLFNPRTGDWDARYASALAPLDWLPEVGWADELAGTLHAEAAAATGLAVGTQLAFGTIDALSEAISVGVVKPGDLMLMYGSTTFFVLVQDQPTPDALYAQYLRLYQDSKDVVHRLKAITAGHYG